MIFLPFLSNRVGIVESLVVLLLALAFDLLLGEFPSRLHPVVWIGSLIALLERAAPQRGTIRQLSFGLTAVLAGLTLVTLPTYYLLYQAHLWNSVLYIVAASLLLKGTFSVKMLRQAAMRIRDLLVIGDLAAARFEMRSLVSRDTSNLDEPLLVAATVESVAENATDSFVSPMFYYLLFGVPGALAYRALNTFDSMIGYRGRYEYLGKAAARLDDAANYIPARLTVALMLIAAWLNRVDFRNAWRVAWRDHQNTASPNAGWTMSVVAGALNVQLEKVGHYRLGTSSAALTPGLIDRAVGLTRTLSILVTSLVILFGVALSAYRP